MATKISPTKGLPGGIDLPLVAADVAGNDVKNIGQTLIIVQTGGTASDVTIAAKTPNRPGDANFPGGTQADLVLTVPINSVRVFGPFPQCFVNTNGDMEVRYSAVTNVKVGAVYVQ